MVWWGGVKFRDADHGVTEHADAEVAELRDLSFDVIWKTIIISETVGCGCIVDLVGLLVNPRPDLEGGRVLERQHGDGHGDWHAGISIKF